MVINFLGKSRGLTADTVRIGAFRRRNPGFFVKPRRPFLKPDGGLRRNFRVYSSWNWAIYWGASTYFGPWAYPSNPVALRLPNLPAARARSGFCPNRPDTRLLGDNPFDPRSIELSWSLEFDKNGAGQQRVGRKWPEGKLVAELGNMPVGSTSLSRGLWSMRSTHRIMTR